MGCSLCAMWLDAVRNPASAFEAEARKNKDPIEWACQGLYHFFIITIFFGVLLVIGLALDSRILLSLSLRGFSPLWALLVGLPMLGVWVVFSAAISMAVIGLAGWLLGGRCDLPKFSFFFSLCLPLLLFLLPAVYHLVFIVAGHGQELEWYFALASALVSAWGLYMLTHAVRAVFRLSIWRAFLAWALPFALALIFLIMMVPPLL
ncbi:MAG: YIP1 family protein [Candidatus Marsarchaeota archaeon]|nr:YIP1 family protein [Candidatus Marsarchaeota archaeon]